MLSKNIAYVDERRCVACGACVKVCPKSALSVHNGCFAIPDLEKCVGCGICANTCPAGCITKIARGDDHGEE